MRTTIRTALVDPDPGSRHALTQLLGGSTQIVLESVHDDYRSAARTLPSNSPELILVAVDGDRDQALELVRAIKKASPKAVVVPASRSLGADEILRFVRAGAPDFLDLPARQEDVLDLLGRLPAYLGPGGGEAGRKEGRILAVAGACGGVGCTSVAVNLAAILAEDRAAKVALMDLDLLFGAVAASLNLNPTHNLLEVLESSERLDHSLLQRSLLHHAETGLHVLPGPEAIEDSSRVDPEPLGRVISMLAELFDYLVIDTGKALHVTDMLALERSDRILMVAQCDLVNLYHSSRLLSLFRRLDGLDDRVRVVLNRVGSESGSISLKKVEGTLGRPVFAQIPNAYRAFHDARTFGAPLDRRGSGKRARPALDELVRLLRSDLGARHSGAPPQPAGRRGRFWPLGAGEKHPSFEPATA